MKDKRKKNYTTLSNLTHSDTVKDFLEKLEAEKIEKIRNNMVKRLIKMRCFAEYKCLGKYCKLVFNLNSKKTT